MLARPRTGARRYAVPEACIGFVMGRSGQTLRTYEDEWGTLMFFAKTKTTNQEVLCIFGPLGARRGAELRVMSTVEHKTPGYCINSKKELRKIQRAKGDEDPVGWGLETVPLDDDDFSYALGPGGAARRKLAQASGCIIEYVGRLACFCGYKKDRRRAKDYLRWMLEQRVHFRAGGTKRRGAFERCLCAPRGAGMVL